MVFVEDYDINVGRHLVQGVDRLDQQPAASARGMRHERPEGGAQRRPQPSILDGWWAEAYDGLNGFAIGAGETHTSVDVHDARDARRAASTRCATRSCRSTTIAIATGCRANGSPG